jgi:HD-like signal output (HDOD) protein
MSDKTEGELAENNSENLGKSSGGIFGIQFPADPPVWNEARRLVSDKNLRVEDLAVCSSQDPAIVMELLKIANAMFFSGGKSPITSIKTAIVRLGSDVIVDILEKIKIREQIEDLRLSHWFEIHRSRGKRAAILSRMLSETLARTMADDCQASALFSFTGEMLAVMHLKLEYAKLAEENARSTVLYRLAQDHRFDCETTGLSYLRRYGIPEILVAALDRDARPRQSERAIIKPICYAAVELIEAFDSGKWDKVAPGRNLPPKSNIRLLGLTDSQYLKVFERATEYLTATRAMEERRRSLPAEEFESPQKGDIKLQQKEPELGSLDDDICSLIDDLPPIEEAPQAQEKAYVSEFGLDTGNISKRSTPRETKVKEIEIPKIALPNSKVQAMVAGLSGVFDNAKSSEEVLSKLLDMLVKPGPFEKSALIVVSKDRKKAVVVAARGPGIENRQMLQLNDPLSPLAQCFSKVQSFGNKSSSNSPFGSKAYALSPIDADHDSPVALYADCGSSGSITFEARRVFRVVVELLNQKLPSLAGGIPVEI